MLLRRAAVLAAVAALLVDAAPAAGARPITVPGGLRPHQQAAASGDCSLGGVVCKPGRSGSCTGYASQATTPAAIRVLVRTGTSSYRIDSVPFQTYVANVLPNEWVPRWDGDALKAGAVAVKSYAWYWITHFGGYVSGYTTGNTAKCFDVTDDTSFQVYRAGSAQTRTTAAVTASWPVALRKDGRIVQASYRAYLNNSGEACGAYADGTTMSQYGSQTCNETSTGYKYNVILQKYYGADAQLATTRQRRTAHDFTFTQRSTRALFASGTWSIDDGYPTTFHYGTAGDLPTITDNGDGFAHIGVFRPATGVWYLASPTGSTAARTEYGIRGDIPTPGHYAGNTAPSVLSVYRPSTHQWWIRGRGAQLYGAESDVPVPGDYSGDGTSEIALWRPSNGVWYRPGAVATQWGVRGDVPIPADYDGNGTTDLAVYRPSNHRFYVRGRASVEWGLAGDVPVVGDFTGDGLADLMIYRPANHRWYLHGQMSRAFGIGGVPVGSGPYRA